MYCVIASTFMGFNMETDWVNRTDVLPSHRPKKTCDIIYFFQDKTSETASGKIHHSLNIHFKTKEAPQVKLLSSTTNIFGARILITSTCSNPETRPRFLLPQSQNPSHSKHCTRPGGPRREDGCSGTGEAPRRPRRFALEGTNLLKPHNFHKLTSAEPSQRGGTRGSAPSARPPPEQLSSGERRRGLFSVSWSEY